MTSKNITNDVLYQRMDSMRKELTQAITTAVQSVSVSQGRLEKKFDDLEAGRLTRAEGNINDLRVELQKAINMFNVSNDANKVVQASLSTKFVIIGAIASAILLGLAQAVFTKLIK